MSKLAFRKPAMPEGAEAFIARGDERPAVAAVKPAPTESSKPRRGLVQRARKGTLDRVTAYLPVELGERLRVHCALERDEMSAVIAAALESYLDSSSSGTGNP